MRALLSYALVVLLMLCVAGQSHRLTTLRRNGLPKAYVGYSAQTPSALTFVMAGLGGFRGLIAEILWFRVNRLQEEGRYLELVQLADWITYLDPHATEAWIYNAWNLTYNVSVMMRRNTDRLRWIKNGIALLRDDALRFNPREARLYRELAWIYQNKIGDSLDSGHLAYKLDLATEMMPLLNPDGTVKQASPMLRTQLADRRLNLDDMLALQKQFGSLDWRLAETHAIYWASQGLKYASGTERLMCQRAIYQPLILSVFHGHVTGCLEDQQWKTLPFPELALPTAEFLLATVREHPSKNMTHVYLLYLARTIPLLEQHGLRQQVEGLYARLIEQLPTGMPRPSLQDIFSGWQP